MFQLFPSLRRAEIVAARVVVVVDVVIVSCVDVDHVDGRLRMTITAKFVVKIAFKSTFALFLLYLMAKQVSSSVTNKYFPKSKLVFLNERYFYVAILSYTKYFGYFCFLPLIAEVNKIAKPSSLNVFPHVAHVPF